MAHKPERHTPANPASELMPGTDRAASDLEVADPDPERWDSFVASISGDVLAQTTAWARTKAPGQKHEVVGVFDGDHLVGGCMLLLRSLGPLRIAYAPRGPIFSSGYEGASTLVVAEIERRFLSWRPSALIVQPTRLDSLTRDAFHGAGLSAAPLDIAPAASVEVDLAPEPDEILARMRSSRRRNIRKAERLGVEVRRGNEAELATFHELHTLTADRQGFAPLTLDYLVRQWEVLAPSGAMRVYLAYLDGEPLAAATVTAFSDRMVFKLAGLSENPEARRARASDYLHWRVLCAARDDGFSFYDLGGFDRDAALIIEKGGDPPEELRTTASQFKLGFGGRVVTRPKAMWRLGPGAVRLGQQPLTAAFDRFSGLRDRLNMLRTD